MNPNLKTHNTLLQLSVIMGRLDGEKTERKKNLTNCHPCMVVHLWVLIHLIKKF
jgi:hypothetical protein